MMKIAIDCFGFSAIRSAETLVGFHRKFNHSLRTSDKVDLTWKSMKWNESLADKARSLIYGERKYVNFSPEEKEIVDYYQQKKLEEDAVILPNTQAALEQDEIEQMLRKRN